MAAKPAPPPDEPVRGWRLAAIWAGEAILGWVILAAVAWGLYALLGMLGAMM
jgi:hypothetical protein